MNPSRNAARAFAPWILAASLLLLLTGCKGATPIRKLLDDPSHYDGLTIQIAGEVTQSIGLLGKGAYQVDDGTGRLLVISKAGGAPREGAKVGVKGVFKAAFTFQTETAAVLMESERYTR